MSQDWITAVGRMGFGDLLTALHARRYTGPVTFHFFAGTATSAELPKEPIRIRLDGPTAATLVVDTTGILSDTPR